VQRLAGEPDLSYLGACLWADALRSKRDPLAAVRCLYEALAAGAGALVEADAAAWDWARRAELTTEDRLLLLLEQAYTQCSALLNQVSPITIAEGTSLGRLVVQLARTHEMILERRPPAREATADYSALSDADLETLRGILDRAKA
jgi:hypothetical protein